MPDAKKIQARNSQHIENLGKDSESFLHFLSTMSKFHKYSLNDLASLAIVAPRNFSAVADADFWKKKFNHSIKKNARGIEIVRDGKLVTVFDISETSAPKDSKPVTLWEYEG